MDANEHRLRDLIEPLADAFALTESERAEMLPSGAYTRFYSRIAWAATYLRQAKLLESPSRGLIKITQRGLDALKSRTKIDNDYLRQFSEFRAFEERSRGHSSISPQLKSDVQEVTPDEALQQAFNELRASLINEVHDALLQASPAFFERAVVDLLLAMGYGGSIEDAGTLLGGSGDGGVDGAIKEDQLGLDTIYVQAKKWARDNTVGDSEIRNFIGALQLHRARKGVFFTTSDFTKSAKASAAHSESRVVLINGIELATLMVEHKVGVSVTSTLELKKLDSDYFEE